MDNLNCLETLTENIVKKQNDSLESVKNLCRKTDMVNSDISNLINSLQMVGNRQFAENRVHDDESGNEQQQPQQSLITRQQQQGDMHESTAGSQVLVSRELKLSSILLKAIELVPPRSMDFDSTPKPSDEAQLKKKQSEQNRFTEDYLPEEERQAQTRQLEQMAATRLLMDVVEAASSKNINTSEETKPQPKPALNPKPALEPEKPLQDKKFLKHLSEQTLPDENQQQQEPRKTKPMDRDRITDILKRYSLYDDDEDDESE